MIPAVVTVLAAAAWTGAQAPAPASPPVELVFFDSTDDHGRLAGGTVLLPYHPPDWEVEAADTAPSFTLHAGGSPKRRLDIVYVGDGYTADELGLYAHHVDIAVATLLETEPFRRYRSLINIHRVDVVSAESGIDNDPEPGTDRDTALGMSFWCNGVERLLCVDVIAARAYAQNAPDADQIFAVANSTRYGGAGYPVSNIATFAGGHGWSDHLALHEFGHSLGDLADEYASASGSTYGGAEPDARNVSTLDADAMALAGTKWAPWLDDPGIGFGGLVSTYEGAMHYTYGIFRPTDTSKMRQLAHPFNLPSAEALVLAIYEEADVVDAWSPPLTTLRGTEIVTVTSGLPDRHPVRRDWRLDGNLILGAGKHSLSLAALPIPPGTHELVVTIVDDTLLVRDQPARDQLLTRHLTWPVVIEPNVLRADVDGNGRVDTADLLIVLEAIIDGDGVEGLLLTLEEWSSASRETGSPRR